MMTTPSNDLSTTSLPETIWEQWHLWMINGALVILCVVVLVFTLVVVVRRKRVLKRGTCFSTDETVSPTESVAANSSNSPPSYEEAMQTRNNIQVQTIERVVFMST